MELRQLRYFLRVAETLNFSLAAKELFITQSTLSQQILHLEQELDQHLFDRNSHEVTLTEAGQMLVPLARQTVNASNDCVQQLVDLKGIQAGELNIGVTFSFSSIATETMLDFLKQYPRVKLNVRYDSMAELMDRLMRHELDLVLAFKPTARYPHIESQTLFNNCLAAIVGKYHPLARQQSVTLDELQRFDLALPSKGLQARNALDKILASTDRHYNVRVEINNVHQLFRLIRATQYVTVLSESTVMGEDGLRAIRINAPGNDMAGCIHTLRDSYLKASAQEFIRMLCQSTSILKYSAM
ncbi:MAG: LysR family transcriptional regulator [Prevotella sp.]|nr:LysR family transcriptional regulator [Prevotella sp.]